MCGIAGILNIKTQTKELRDKALKMAQKIRHRGPDWRTALILPRPETSARRER